jgi:hypothetical protein
MTHLAMPEQWRFRGVDLSTWAVMVRSVDGADEHPPLRGENTAVPSIAGRRFARKAPDQRRIALALYVQSMAADGTRAEATNERQVRANLDALYAVLGLRTQGALVRVMPDGSERTAQAEVVAVGSIEDSFGKHAIGLTADFLLADPYMYGAPASTTQAAPASPADFTVVNAGSAATHRAVLTLTGPLANPRLANLTIDPGGAFWCECLVTVAAGTDLVVDCGAWTALNDGVNAIGSVRHSGAFEFFRLDPGANSLRLTATSAGGSVRLDWSPPFI